MCEFIKPDIQELENIKLFLGDRIGNCRLIITDQHNSPILYIKSEQVPFFCMISMFTGEYFFLDELNQDEMNILNNFMIKVPNYHDEFHGWNASYNNWAFMLIQYLGDYNYYLKNEKLNWILNNIKFIYNDITPKFNIKPERYSKTPSTIEWIDYIYSIKGGK